MRLKPEKYTQLHTALCKAFNPNSFTSMLKGGLGLELTDVSSNNAPFPTMCGDVIRWAEERDQVEGLIAAAYSVNDTNRRLQRVRDEFDATWFQTDTTLEDPRDATQFDHRNQTIQGHQVNVDGDTTIDHIGDVYHQYYGSVSDQDKVSEESKRPLFYVDFLQNERFKGRERELAALHAKLQQENAVGIRPAAAVSGMGGIGKTQLAVEYVYRYRDAYPGGVAWLNAAERLRPQLLAVARDLHLTVEDPQRPDFDDQLLVALTNYLSANPQTLFVFDNVDDPVLFAQRQLGAGKNPLTFGGTLLLTTRRRDFPTGIEDFNLKTVDLPTARAIVSGTRHGMADDPDLDALCDMLGLLPLALNLAAAALRDTDASIADYMADLKELGADRYAEEAELSLEDYYAASLTPALEAQWRGLENDKTARHLFAVAGQLHEAAVIPVARLGLLAGVRDRRSIKKLTRGVQALVNACLVEQLAEGQIRLHPLVQEFAEARVESAQRHVVRLHCARNLRDAYWGLEEMQRQYVDRGALALQEDLLTALDLVTFQQTAEFGPEMSGLAEVTRQLGMLLRTLQREIHTLLQRDLLGKATRFAQQMQYRVVDRAIDPLRQQAERLCGNLRGERWRTLLSRRRESPALERTLAGHAYWVGAVAVTQDGRRAVSASDDRTLKVWNLETGAEEHTLSGHAAEVSAVAVTQDGRRAVSASDDRTLKVWNLETGAEEHTLSGHAAWVRAVAVTQDGRRAVSASSDRTLKVWNLETGAEEHTLSGHADGVRAVAVTQDGRRAVSASYDSTLKVWNLETGTLLTSITLDDQMLAVGIVPAASSTADRLYFTVFAGGSGGGVYYLEYREA